MVCQFSIFSQIPKKQVKSNASLLTCFFYIKSSVSKASLNDLRSFSGLYHVAGDMSSSIGKISSLPAIISKQHTSFESRENPLKLPAGPIALKPGPILFIVVTTELIVVIISNPSSDIMSTETTKTHRYATR